MLPTVDPETRVRKSQTEDKNAELRRSKDTLKGWTNLRTNCQMSSQRHYILVINSLSYRNKENTW